MKRHAAFVIALVVALGAGSYAVAGGGKNHLKTDLSGYEENPDVSTTGGGSFDARVDERARTIAYELRYGAIEGTVQQAHIHFGKRAVNAGVSVFLCTNLGNGPAGTQPCPQSGTVSGTIRPVDVLGPAGQGIEPGAFDELVAAMRAGSTYVNVHSTKWPGGEIRGQVDDRRHHGGGDDDD